MLTVSLLLVSNEEYQQKLKDERDAVSEQYDEKIRIILKELRRRELAEVIADWDFRINLVCEEIKWREMVRTVGW